MEKSHLTSTTVRSRPLARIYQTVLSALVLTAGAGAFAQPAITVSGAIDGGVGYIQTDSASASKLASGSIAASSLTFQGNEDLGGGYAATFVLRSLFVTGSGAISGAKFFGSEAKVGLQGPAGKIELGRLFDIMHQVLVFKSPSQSNFAGAFNMAIGGYSPYWDNSVRYTSPVIQGFTFEAQHSFGLLDNEPVAPNTKNGIGSVAALHYVNGPANISGVLEQTDVQNLPTVDNRAYRRTLMGTYDFGVVTAHLGYVSETNSGLGAPLQYDLSIVGASAWVSPLVKLTAELGFKNFKNSPNKAEFVGLGAFYSLSKRTLLYSELTAIRNEGAAQQAIYRGIAVKPGENTLGYMVGIRHSY